MKKKLEDTDYLYITARVRSLERGLLNRERAERMLESRSDEDAVKVLVECGYGDIPSSSPEDLERALTAGRGGMFAMLERVVPSRSLIDVFRVKYDYHNLKAILKSEAKSLNPEPLLIDSGRVRSKQLMEMIRQDDTRGLPPVMRAALYEARDVLARTDDPQLSDMTLDRALFDETREMALESRSKFLMEYVKLNIDLTNLRAVVRASRIGRGADFLRSLLIPGGKVDNDRLLTAAISGASLTDLYSGSLLEEAASAGAAAARRETSLTLFEKLGDEAVIKYLKASKYVAFGEQPLIAYIAAKESEIVSIRAIMSGRKTGVPHDVIRERLRETYV